LSLADGVATRFKVCHRISVGTRLLKPTLYDKVQIEPHITSCLKDEAERKTETIALKMPDREQKQTSMWILRSSLLTSISINYHQQFRVDEKYRLLRDLEGVHLNKFILLFLL
jgi:hypothetical protein